MSRHLIIIDFDPGHIHRLRNFGEDVWRSLREYKWAAIPLEEIDRAKTQLCVTVHSARHVKRVHTLVLKLLKEHFLDGVSRVSPLPAP